jgi:drug/metabolite transporter (DMT)-like permease
LTTVATVLIEYVLFGKIPSRSVAVSVVLLSIGALLTGWSDADFNMKTCLSLLVLNDWADVLALLSCITQATYLLIVARVERQHKIQPSSLLVATSFHSVAPLFILFLFSQELEILRSADFLSGPFSVPFSSYYPNFCRLLLHLLSLWALFCHFRRSCVLQRPLL